MVISKNIQTIINKTYNIVDLELFAKEYCTEYNYNENSVLTNFQYIESTEMYIISMNVFTTMKPKITIKSMEKSLNLQSDDYINKEGLEYFSYSFYKKFLSIVNIEEFKHLERLEYIYIVDNVQRNFYLKHAVSQEKVKKQNLYKGIIISYDEITEDGKIINIEFIKYKNGKESIDNDKKIIKEFTFDYDTDKIKLFNEDIKKLFQNKLEIIDDNQNIELNKKRLEISQMTHIPKDERNNMEKALKFHKTTPKSMKICVKSNKVSYLENKQFILTEILEKIDINLSTYKTVEYINKENKVDEDTSKNDIDEDTSKNDIDEDTSKNDIEEDTSENDTEEEQNEENNDDFMSF